MSLLLTLLVSDIFYHVSSNFSCIPGETNGSRFELFALLGEARGSGLPLGFILIRSNDGEPGGLAEYLSEFISYFKETWNIEARITLTDKNSSEINAFRRVFPDAKYQLCFWHVLRAVKTRLSILRRSPAYYDVESAHKEFDFIDKNFLPVGQIDGPSSVGYHCLLRDSLFLTLFSLVSADCPSSSPYSTSHQTSSSRFYG